MEVLSGELLSKEWGLAEGNPELSVQISRLWMVKMVEETLGALHLAVLEILVHLHSLRT